MEVKEKKKEEKKKKKKKKKKSDWVKALESTATTIALRSVSLPLQSGGVGILLVTIILRWSVAVPKTGKEIGRSGRGGGEDEETNRIRVAAVWVVVWAVVWGWNGEENQSATTTLTATATAVVVCGLWFVVAIA